MERLTASTQVYNGLNKPYCYKTIAVQKIVIRLYTFMILVGSSTSLIVLRLVSAHTHWHTLNYTVF